MAETPGTEPGIRCHHPVEEHFDLRELTINQLKGKTMTISKTRVPALMAATDYMRASDVMLQHFEEAQHDPDGLHRRAMMVALERARQMDRPTTQEAVEKELENFHTMTPKEADRFSNKISKLIGPLVTEEIEKRRKGKMH
jgi:hypothetical protein